MTSSPAHFLDPLRAILEKAGGIIRHHYEKPSSVTLKSDGSPLTAADRETNELLRQELGRLFPEAGWLSEESAPNRERLECEWAWVVDPLDGTKEFVRKIPELSISVGLVHRGEAALGGVFNPLTREGAVGGPGLGLSVWGVRNDQRRSAPASLAQVKASVSRTEVEDGILAPYVGLVEEARIVGSVAYKLLRAAVGVDDITFSMQPKSEWDVCGGVALLQAEGRDWLRLDGAPARFNQSNPRIPCGSVGGVMPLAAELAERLNAISASA